MALEPQAACLSRILKPAVWSIPSRDLSVKNRHQGPIVKVPHS